MFIELIGKLIGFAIFVGIIYILIKTKGTHPEKFTLDEGEEIIKMSKGDCWEIEYVILKTRNTGEFAFTNKRILFRQNFFGNFISIPYSEIAEVKKSFIMVFPVSFDVKTKDGKTYRLSMMKRQQYLDVVNAQLSKAE